MEIMQSVLWNVWKTLENQVCKAKPKGQEPGNTTSVGVKNPHFFGSKFCVLSASHSVKLVLVHHTSWAFDSHFFLIITYLSWHMLQHHLSVRTCHLCQIWQDSRKLPKLQRGAAESAVVVSKCGWDEGPADYIVLQHWRIWGERTVLQRRWDARDAAASCPQSADCTPLCTMFLWKNAKQGFLSGPHKIPCPCSLVMNYGWKIETAGHRAKRRVNIWHEVCSYQALWVPLWEIFMASLLGILANGQLLRLWPSLWPKFTGKLYSVTPCLIYHQLKFVFVRKRKVIQ